MRPIALAIRLGGEANLLIPDAPLLQGRVSTVFDVIAGSRFGSFSSSSSNTTKPIPPSTPMANPLSSPPNAPRMLRRHANCLPQRHEDTKKGRKGNYPQISQTTQMFAG